MKTDNLWWFSAIFLFFFAFLFFLCLFSLYLDYIQIKKIPIILLPMKLLFICIRTEKSKIVLERGKDKLFLSCSG